MVRIDAVYEGDLHTVCSHEPSGAKLPTDAPADNEGRGEAFSPTDLVASALGSCVLTVMGIVARRHDWPLEGARAEIEKHMVVDPVRRIGSIVIRVSMPAGLPEASRAVLERTATTCPVKASLHPEVKVDLSFRYADSGPE